MTWCAYQERQMWQDYVVCTTLHRYRIHLTIPTAQIGSWFFMGTIKALWKNSYLHVFLYCNGHCLNWLNYSHCSSWFLICYGTIKALWKDLNLHVVIYFNGHFFKWHITLLELCKISTEKFMIGAHVILFPFLTDPYIWMHMFSVPCRYVQASVPTYWSC